MESERLITTVCSDYKLEESKERRQTRREVLFGES